MNEGMASPDQPIGGLPASDRSLKGSLSFSSQAWSGYLKNLGNWIGKRALCNSRGRVLLDIPTRVITERFRTPDGEDFVLWRTLVRTADGIDEAEEEWSRLELGDFGALVADGSFSIGAQVFQGEPMKVEHCLTNGQFRVRTTHAYEWDGCLSGIVATRERVLQESDSGSQTRTAARQFGFGFVEPAAWRSPRLLFDYILGLWEGRGVSIDSRTGETHTLTSRQRLTQETEGVISDNSLLRIADGGPSRVFRGTAKLDENLLLYSEDNLQVFLLPGGIYVSSPICIRSGRPFALETAFLMRPDCRKRVIRLYNRECEWVNTVFINERRVG